MPFIGGSRYSQIRWPGMADFILDRSATDVMLLLPSIEASSLQGNFGGAGMNVDDSLGKRIGREWDGAKVNDPIGSMRYMGSIGTVLTIRKASLGSETRGSVF